MREIKVLVIALHPRLEGYVGGGWLRLIALIRHSKNVQVRYTLIESYPMKKITGLDYDSVKTIFVPGRGPLQTLMLIVEAIFRGISKAVKYRFDLVLSPNEAWYQVIPAFFIGLLARVPWTSVMLTLPVYGSPLPPGTIKTSTRSLYSYTLRFPRAEFPGIRIFWAITASLSYRLLRRTIVGTIGSVGRDLERLDTRFHYYKIDPPIASSLSPPNTIKINCTYAAVYVGPLTLRKGIPDLLLCWSDVCKEFPAAKLALVGKGTPGILKELRKMMRDLKIEDKVAFPFEPTRGASYGTELVSVLTDSRMMIYPSKMDTAPMSIMDSLACGLPVIAYDIPGVRETYGKCDAVILVPPGDIAALTRETISLLKDDVRWSQLKEKAIAFCRQKSWDKVALAERGFYVRVIHQLRNRSSRPPHQQD